MACQHEIKAPFKNTEKNFTIKAVAEKVDYSGTYTGVLYVAETGKEIDVTTVVTFEKDFGDGSLHKIVCSNDETGSTYINNSYFVRVFTGEANIGEQNLYSPQTECRSALPCATTTIKRGSMTRQR